MRKVIAGVALGAGALAGGAYLLTQTPASDFSTGAQRDATPKEALPAEGSETDLISAFFGLDDSWRIRMVGYRLCAKLTGADGMPVVFPEELDIRTIEAADMRVTLASGKVGRVDCVTLAPAIDPGELRTLLMIGDFGSADEDPPVLVEVVGNLGSLDGQINFRGASVAVTPLHAGPSLVFAESVPKGQWRLDQGEAEVPADCPADGLKQIVRVVWDGGVDPLSDETTNADLAALYQVTLAMEDGSTKLEHPFALGNTGDVDNNVELCMDTAGIPTRVSFPGGHLVDPNDDVNADSAVTVTP